MSLLEAARSGDADTVSRLIREGVDVNKTDVRGYQAIHFAAANGRSNVIEI
uniref:ankyrin repeat domain-containing protein n=1 Tax=Wolbachia endosymbiont of Pentidionis agamae TaxID=3110435 RepID=UPI0038CD4999